MCFSLVFVGNRSVEGVESLAFLSVIFGFESGFTGFSGLKITSLVGVASF